MRNDKLLTFHTIQLSTSPFDRFALDALCSLPGCNAIKVNERFVLLLKRRAEEAAQALPEVREDAYHTPCLRTPDLNHLRRVKH